MPSWEKKMHARGSGFPWGSQGATQSSAATCNIDEWMWSLVMGAFDREVDRTDNVHAHYYGSGCTCTWHIGGGRQHGWQGTPGVTRCFSRGSPSSGGGSSDLKSNQSSLHSTMTGPSSGSNRSVHVGRGPWVKVNLPIFKDEKSKDAVTYHLWWWDVVLFLWSW